MSTSNISISVRDIRDCELNERVRVYLILQQIMNHVNCRFFVIIIILLLLLCPFSLALYARPQVHLIYKINWWICGIFYANLSANGKSSKAGIGKFCYLTNSKFKVIVSLSLLLPFPFIDYVFFFFLRYGWFLIYVSA